MAFEETDQQQGEGQPRPLHERMAEMSARAQQQEGEGEQPAPADPPRIEAAKVEVLPEPIRSAGYATDGNMIPAAAETTGQFIDLLEDGQFSADAQRQIQSLGLEMLELARLTTNKQKGKVVITIDMECEDRAFKITSDLKVTRPKVKRPRSHLWTDDHGRFTRFPSGQNQMFGVRTPAPGNNEIRRV